MSKSITQLINAYKQQGFEGLVSIDWFLTYPEILSVPENEQFLPELDSVFDAAMTIITLELRLKYEFEKTLSQNRGATEHITELADTIEREGLIYTLVYKISASSIFNRRNPIIKIINKLKYQFDELNDCIQELEDAYRLM